MWTHHAHLTGFKLTPMLQFSSCLTTRKDMTICEMECRLLNVSIYSITVKTSTYGLWYSPILFNQLFNLLFWWISLGKNLIYSDFVLGGHNSPTQFYILVNWCLI